LQESEAYDYIAGYTVAMDGSARDLQLRRNNGQWLLGKTLDTFCPLGPVLVTRDEIPDPHVLNLSCYVNGVEKQNSNTSQMIFKVTEMIAFYSRYFTFYPGDVILTGCPPGHLKIFKREN
jgi:2-keto-4-pentenoate hydratase/2-oxohepta-3-ene-1,7-dioic acid hydratase in catechol pathway